MNSNESNRRRLFADLVNIDAWHEPFDGTSKVDLHADIVFGIARLGGEADSEIRFRLKAKRAEVLVVIPDTEPVTVDRTSVSRDTPNVRVSDETTVKRGKNLKGKVGVSGNVGSKATALGVDAGISAGAELSKEQKNTVVRESGQISVMQSKTADGFYRWILEPADGSFLDGRPWDANTVPRLKLIDRRSDRSSPLPPCVRVEVRCKREDLEIEELTLKDETVWTALQAHFAHKNRMAAADAYIRSKLISEGLEVKNFDDLFGDITLGSVTAVTTQE